MDHSRDAQQRRVERAQAGWKNRDKPLTEQQAEFCLTHYPLVYTFAARFQAKFPREEFDDLVSIGFETLIRCSRGFEPDRGNKPSTYIVRALMHNWLRECPRNRAKRTMVSTKARVMSMDRSFPDDDPYTYEDNRSRQPLDILIEREEADRQAQSLAALNRKHPRAMTAINMRASGMKLDDVGNQLGVSRTMVQRLEKSVLNTTFSRAVGGFC